MAPWPSTRRPHNLLKVCSEVPIRVPPAQSSTLDEQLASASSGSRARNAASHWSAACRTGTPRRACGRR